MALGIGAILTAVEAAPTALKTIDDIIGRFVPDANQKATAALEMQRLIEQEKMATAKATADLALKHAEIAGDLNMADAQSPSRWRSGWHAALGWTVVACLVDGLIVQPKVNEFLLIYGGWHNVNLPVLPTMDMMQVFALLGALLGVGTLVVAKPKP